MAEREKPERGAPLVLMVEPERPRPHACADCVYRVDHASLGVDYAKCSAFGGYYTSVVRSRPENRRSCEGFIAKPVGAALPVAASRKPGWLKRALVMFLRWIW